MKLNAGRWACALAILSSGAGVSAQCEVATALPAGVASDAGFGMNLLVTNDWLFGSSPFDDTAGFGAGSIQVFRRQSASWTHVAELIGSEVQAGDGFGRRVAFDGERVVAGCASCDDGTFLTGAAFVFEYDGAEWVETAVLKHDDPAALDQLGYSVDLDGDTIVLGTLGEGAYVFELQGGVWVQVQELLADGGSNFGEVVRISGDTILVADSLGQNAPMSFAGSVDVFERDHAGVWTRTERLADPELPNQSLFGNTLEFEGDTALIGASSALGADGQLFVYERDGSTWSQVATFDQADPLETVNFGHQVALEGERFVAIEMRYGPTGGQNARIYERGSDGWAQTLAIPLTTWPPQFLGHHGDEIAIGASNGLTLEPVRVLAIPPIVTLAAAPESISVAAGGAQGLAIDAGPCLAGSLYLLLGSASGTSPGLDVGEFHVPLNFDLYTSFTVTGANTPPLFSTLGALDGDGTAQASIVLPPASNPALAGLTLDHSVVVLDPGTLDLRFVTDERSLQLVP